MDSSGSSDGPSQRRSALSGRHDIRHPHPRPRHRPPARPAAVSPPACPPPAGPSALGSRGRPAVRLGRPGTWAPALDGVAAAYLAYVPDIAFPGRRRRHRRRSPRGRRPPASAGSSCCRAAARTARRAPSGACRQAGRRLDDRARAPVRPELQRGPSSTACSTVTSPCRPATSPSRSSTSTTSPTSPPPRCSTTGHVGQLYEVTGPRLLHVRRGAARSAPPPAATSATCR